MGYLEKLASAVARYKIKVRNHSFKRDAHVWLFGEWFGKRCCDNSLYLANYVHENYPNIQVVWAADEGTDLSLLNEGITTVKFDTEEALRIYKTAGVVFMHQGYVDFSHEGYHYFSGAVTINLWHGVPWKKIGHDASKRKGIIHWFNTYLVDSLEGAKKYLSVSDAYGEILRTAFHARNSQIINAGYPRNSIFYSATDREAAKKKLFLMLESETGKVWKSDTQLVLYMPTFRDKVNDLYRIEELAENEEFVRWLETNNVLILHREHFVSEQRQKNKNEELTDRIIRFNKLTAQEVLAASEMLITDYSSCFFDYLVTDRPIVYFLYDYEYYKTKDRGLYYDYSDVICGDVAWNVDELAQLLKENCENPAKNADLRHERLSKYMKYESANSSEIIMQNVISQLKGF